MDDANTFYLVNGQRVRTYTVQTNPDVLKYKVHESEKGKSADELLQQALQKVRQRSLREPRLKTLKQPL